MLIYKIFRRSEWDALRTAGETQGAPVDVADGFVHFSTAAQVAEVNYPQLKLTTPSGSGVLALVRERDDLQFWVASGKQVLLLRNGLAVRTIGLGLEGDLDGTRLADDSPFKSGLHQVADGFTTRRWIDLYKGQEVGVIVNSRFSRRSTETLEILDKAYSVLRVDERTHLAPFVEHVLDDAFVLAHQLQDHARLAAPVRLVFDQAHGEVGQALQLLQL